MRTWLTVAESAEYAGVSRATIYTACERGELHHARIGGRRSIERTATVLDAKGKTYQTKRGGVVSTNRSVGRLKAFCGAKPAADCWSAAPILHTVQLFLDHANISTSSRYLKPSKLALHTAIQRIDEHDARAVKPQNGKRTWPNCGGICRRGHKKGHTLIQSVFGVRPERPQHHRESLVWALSSVG